MGAEGVAVQIRRIRTGDVMSALSDLRRDWRRWSTAERIGAVVSLLVLICAPAVMFITAYRA